MSNADVNFDSEMQKCDELSVQPSPGATINYSQSMDIIPKNHTAAAITLQTAQAEDGIIYPMFDSGCSTVPTSSMFNCMKVEEHVMSIMQVESRVQMSSTHKCRMTCYDESRDGNIHAIKVNALIVPSLQQDLIGGTNNPDFQVILDQDPNVAEIHPLINGKPYSDEQSIPFISDDLRLFQAKASHMANAA